VQAIDDGKPDEDEHAKQMPTGLLFRAGTIFETQDLTTFLIYDFLSPQGSWRIECGRGSIRSNIPHPWLNGWRRLSPTVVANSKRNKIEEVGQVFPPLHKHCFE
jgi:hypothetical protein